MLRTFLCPLSHIENRKSGGKPSKLKTQFDIGTRTVESQYIFTLIERTSQHFHSLLLRVEVKHNMGIVFGMTGTKEPPFTIISNPPNYQIRDYAPYLIAEVPQVPGKENESFSILAKYIGVFGKPENGAQQSMAMTSPVITAAPKKLAMTSPVLNGRDTMSFVLPFNFKKVSELPVPNDSRVVLRAVPRRILAVTAFSGWYSAVEGEKHFAKLRAWLASDQLIPETGREDSEGPDWSVAQYHPPFTLPFFRRNEIWIELDEKNQKIREMISKSIEQDNSQK